MQTRLGIAIVSFHSTSILERCLLSVAAHSPRSVVAVVENSGEADEVEAICRRVPGLETSVLDPGTNIGFAGAVNLAARRLAAQACTHLLILNADVELTAPPESLLPALGDVDVVAGVLREPGISSVGQKGGRMPAPNAKRPVTWASSVVQAVVGTRFTGVGAVEPGGLTRVPQVDGAYMLQSMDYYLDNQLNEAFELYFEDVEYCERAQGGRGVGIIGQEVGTHVGGHSFRSSGGIGYVANRVSRARYLRMKYPRAPMTVLGTPFLLELATRGATRQPEGSAVRRAACRLAVDELRHPCSVHVLAAGFDPGSRGLNLKLGPPGGGL